MTDRLKEEIWYIKNNINKLNLGALIVAVLTGLIYYMYVICIGKGIKCGWVEYGHVYCPGCGFTRMIGCLLRFDVLSALRNNALGVLSLPFIPVAAIRYLTNQKIVNRYTLIALIFIIILFTVLRNINTFWFLQPI